MRQFVCIVFVLFCTAWVHALDREAFTLTKYDLGIRVEPEQQRLGVRGKITLRNDSGSPQRNVSLQISSSLNWRSITFDGKPVEFLTQTYTSDIDHTGLLSEAIVVLPQPVTPKQSFQLDVGYEGVIPQDTTRLTRIGMPADEAMHSDWDQIGRAFTAVRGAGYVAWYPIATEAASLSDSDSVVNVVDRWKRRESQAEIKVAFTYSRGNIESPSSLLCNGGKANRISGEAGEMSALNCSFTDLSVTVPTFSIAHFLQLDGAAVNINYLSDHKSGAEDYASAVDEVAPLVTNWFGDHREKNRAKAEVLDLPDAQAAPYESGNMLLMPLTGTDTKFLLAASQQLTHLLFPSPRTWIRSGLASYAQVRFIQEKEGRQAAIQYLQAHRGALLESEKEINGAKSRVESRSLIESNDEFRVQTKAMYVWWMLRDFIGEAALNAALHEYKADEDHDVTYVQKLVEGQSHRDLQWFFDDWVYKDRGLPDLHIAAVYPSQLPKGGYVVTVTIENLGGAGAEIPVTLHMQAGEATEKLIVPGKSKATIRIQTPSLPQTVTVNDGSVPESDVSNKEYKVSH